MTREPSALSVFVARLAARPSDASPYLVARHATRLAAIHRALIAIATRQCNGYPDGAQNNRAHPAERDRRAWERLEREADELARLYRLDAKTQGDPRGRCLLLVAADDHEMDVPA